MKALFSVVGLIATLFVGIIAGTLIGGFVGWCVNLVFPVVHDTLNHVTGLQLDAFDQGAVLGFVGGFLRPNASSK
jgi:ABC-type lipoprotein release transport system permease subunit